MDRDLRTLWCGNLSSRVTEDILYELFLQAGPVEEVKIPKDRDSRPRAYGFVTYKYDETVDYAINLFKGTSLYNRELCVDRKVRGNQEMSVPKPELLNCFGIPGMMPAPNLLVSYPMNSNHHIPYPINYPCPNPYGSHVQLGYQGPANMYPNSNDRRHSSRKHPYHRR